MEHGEYVTSGISAKFRFEAYPVYHIELTIYATDVLSLLTREFEFERNQFETLMKEKYPNEDLEFRYMIQDWMALGGFRDLWEKR